MSRAVIALVLLSMFGCRKSGSLQPEELRSITDSASSHAWSESSVKPTKHSTVYDSLYRYYKDAAGIEKSRVALEDSLATYLPLLQNPSDALNDTVRHSAILAFQDAMSSSDSLQASLVNTIAQCTRYADTALKRLSESENRKQLRAYMLSPDRFAPTWRATYDSLEQLTNSLVIDILGLFDSARGNVVIDSTSGNRFRFRDIDLTSRYNALRDSLAHLGAELDAQRRNAPMARK